MYRFHLNDIQHSVMCKLMTEYLTLFPSTFSRSRGITENIVLILNALKSQVIDYTDFVNIYTQQLSSLTERT